MSGGRRASWRQMAVLVLGSALLAGVIIDLVVDLQTRRACTAGGDSPGSRAALPCPAIPTRLILEDPVCAQKLLDSMNVSHVRIGADIAIANGSRAGR